ncbi:MAG: hypothetical protein A3G23_08635 [Bacteroidetes bacterium RIFCSPLOWO2_12_FULL_37_12]|nr:MAG: hypothetical protein A3G23_08635 [Bacteroidetes bacterium RIFCSPLOWO2_12_FULL_37_12]
MNPSFYIASRYFFTRKKRNIIHWLSIISMVGIAIGTMALVVVLSVFNGFKGLIHSLYVSFDPDLLITAKEGKRFSITELDWNKIVLMPGVKNLSKISEDNALAKYGEKQMVVRIKGVDESFAKNSGIKDHILTGNFQFNDSNYPNLSVIGQGVQSTLGINLYDELTPLNLWYPGELKKVHINPENAFTRKNIFVSGIFSLEKHYDDQYVLVPLSFAQELFSDTQRISSLEVTLINESYAQTVKKQIQQIIREKFKIEDRFEQHKSLFTILNIEKFAIFLILTLIILIASFNIYSSLLMLVMDKKKDIAILFALGLDPKNISRIFTWNGMMICLSGAFSGLVLGFLFCLLQKEYGLISLGDISLIVSTYPVEMAWLDFATVFIVVAGITFLASIYPAGKAGEMARDFRMADN